MKREILGVPEIVKGRTWLLFIRPRSLRMLNLEEGEYRLYKIKKSEGDFLRMILHHHVEFDRVLEELPKEGDMIEMEN